MIPALFNFFFRWIMLFLALCFVIALFTGKSRHCVFDEKSKTVQFQMGQHILDIPRKYLSVCKNRDGQIAAMDLIWPEFERKPKFNRKNREQLIKKRLIIGLVEKEFSPPEGMDVWREKILKRTIEEKNPANGNPVYADGPQNHANGMIVYYPTNSNIESHLKQDIYTLRDKNGKLKIVIKCNQRPVGGASCRNDSHMAFDTISVSYSFDISHLQNAIEIDQKVKDFIENMIVSDRDVGQAQ